MMMKVVVHRQRASLKMSGLGSVWKVRGSVTLAEVGVRLEKRL